MAALPPINRNPYNQQMRGVYGEFGSGAGLQAFYLQTAVTPAMLDKISLISDIKGSERWPIRDLFQRDVDNERVTDSLLPYLQDAEKIKFFNPLTLTVLPMDEKKATVLRRMPKVTERTMDEDGHTWKILERERFYRVRWIDDHHEWAQLEWNDDRSRLVAIDGPAPSVGAQALRGGRSRRKGPQILHRVAHSGRGGLLPRRRRP